MLKLIKEIKSKEGEIHFRRWRVLTTPWFDINIHGIYKADEDDHLHNHPWNIFTMILKGGYTEETECGFNVRGFLNMRYSNTKAFHKIYKMHTSPTYTLAIMSNRKGNWGYLIHDEHPPMILDHKKYRQFKREGKL